MTPLHLIVEADADSEGEGTPRARSSDRVRLSIGEILDRGYTEPHSCVYVRASNH